MPPRAERGGGFSLVELMVAATLSGLVLAGVLSVSLHLLRSGVRVTEYAEMSTQVRRALEQLGGDLRSASGVTWNGSSDVTLLVPTTAGGTRQVTYAWTGASREFFLVPGASSAATAGRVVLVRGIPVRADGSAGVVFGRFDRDGNAVTTDLATKRVQVILYPTRTGSAGARTTGTAVSAVFTLRNKPTS